ncbi:hypothetical protein BDY19DRAFT_900034, partial [Irpex rosettiformis]
LTLYEYCLTLSQERELIWRRRISVVSVLFLVNRYAIILQGIFNVIKASIWIYHHDKDLEEKVTENLVYLPTSGEDTNIFQTFHILTFIIAFSAIRAYAIWDRDKRIFLVSLVLCLVYVGCTIVRNRIANSCNIMFEIIVIALTWIKTIPTLRLSRGTNASFFPTLVYVMYRDGEISSSSPEGPSLAKCLFTFSSSFQAH